MRDDVAVTRTHFDEAESASPPQAERCDQPSPAFRCRSRCIYQVLRGCLSEQVFAQTLLGFEAKASADPRVVGINLVMPEDGYVSMSDYTLQMRMVGYLHGVPEGVHITLHAGELAPGLVTYDDLPRCARRSALLTPNVSATAWTSCSRIGPTNY